MPQTDLARIRHLADAACPDMPGVDLRSAREIDNGHVTVVELRPLWDDKDSSEWVWRGRPPAWCTRVLVPTERSTRKSRPTETLEVSLCHSRQSKRVI